MDLQNGQPRQDGNNYEQGEAEVKLFDLFMQEYPAYTVNKIEEELTYELLYLFVRTAAERRQQRTKKKSNVTDIDIEDLAEGRASLQGFGVEKVVKH